MRLIRIAHGYQNANSGLKNRRSSPVCPLLSAHTSVNSAGWSELWSEINSHGAHLASPKVSIFMKYHVLGTFMDLKAQRLDRNREHYWNKFIESPEVRSPTLAKQEDVMDTLGVPVLKKKALTSEESADFRNKTSYRGKGSNPEDPYLDSMFAKERRTQRMNNIEQTKLKNQWMEAFGSVQEFHEENYGELIGYVDALGVFWLNNRKDLDQILVKSNPLFDEISLDYWYTGLEIAYDLIAEIHFNELSVFSSPHLFRKHILVKCHLTRQTPLSHRKIKIWSWIWRCGIMSSKIALMIITNDP